MKRSLRVTSVMTTSVVLSGLLLLAGCGSSKSSGGEGAGDDGAAASGSGSTATGSGGTGAGTDAASNSGFTGVSSTSGGAISAATGSGGTSAAGTDGGPTADEGGGEGNGAAGAAGAGNDPVELDPGVLTAGTWDDNMNFDWFSGYYGDQVEEGLDLTGWFSLEEHEAALENFVLAPGAHDTLDISLVIDTTGSMGDELDYLQVEFDAISSAIEQRYQNAQQRWSLVVYRDEGDDYVTRSFDFTSDLDAFRSDLGAQTHGGGGDFPEAADRGLEDMTSLDWRDDQETLRLAFWVADAPHHHDDEEVVDRITQALKDSMDQGIRINPIASSGVDELTEFTMRSAAQLTGGKYMFLTDDSGVGGEHKEPTIPCYYVTTLADALLRVVDSAMTGDPAPVDQNQVVRAVGKPSSTGVCEVGERAAVAF